MLYWNSLAFLMIQQMLAILSLVSFSAFSKSNLNIWKFTVSILLKPGLENFDHYFTSVWVMYGCESWTVKKAECRRIDAFELWCWRRLLRVLWTAGRSKQSILKEISPGISLELEWILTFSSPVATAEFSKFAGILSAALSQHHLSGFEIAPPQFHHFH